MNKAFLAVLSPSTRRTVIWYGFTIFLSSAVLLVLEIAAGRLIAPYVGVSIYSWTSIIGVILAGLSLGNWLGGHWADKGAGELGVGVVLVLSACFSLASLLFLTFVAPLLQSSQLDLISSSFIYVMSMFFIPSVLLGVVTPVLTTLALRLDDRLGHIVGRMNALAALGSIFGTFITGYWLLQYFGTRKVIIGSAVCLALLALPYLRKIRAKQAIAVLLVGSGVIGLTEHRRGFADPCQWESNYFCLRVDDASDPNYGNAVALILDHLIHGINHVSDPELLISPYVHAMDELVKVHFNADPGSELSYFFAGGGAYTQQRAVKAMYPSASVTVAELDPTVTRVVQEALFVDIKGMNIIHEDARVVLQKRTGPREPFDVIVADAFHDISVPYHMVTLEFIQTVKRNLKPNGLYLLNIIDGFPDARLAKSLVKTLQQEFDYVDVWLDQAPAEVTRVTYVISAQNEAPFPDMVFSQQGFQRRWLRINVPLIASGTPLESLPILTDDYVPVDRLLSKILFGAGAL
ncbi:MAG: fused MFS/spermidine synthase [Gammaproteobacteria bacterium]|nr:fused MFS/spermidine synthase [Gammaproteobacteria bacterium]MDH5801491.1 fused MFS/spermidine synthase [Gammaproteobacteria bacterium]